MINGKPAITAYFETIGAPYFAIFQKGKVESGNSIYRNDKDGDKEYDYASGKEAFEKMLELLQYGEYTIVISDKKNVSTRGSNREDFKIGLNESAPGQAPASNSGISGITMEEVERKAESIATKRFQELMDKKELADTKEKLKEAEKELKEAQKSVSDPWNKLITAAAPHADHIIAGLTGRPIPPVVVPALTVSGVKPDHESEADPEAQSAAENFIQALATAKPGEWKQILVKLTHLIQDHPHKFETALTFI